MRGMPAKTPLVSHFRTLDSVLYRIDYALHLMEWSERVMPQVYARLRDMGDPLADEFFREWDNAVMMGGMRSLESIGLHEIFLCRAVDEFHQVLVALVREVFRRRPEALGVFGRETVAVGEVLKSASLDEFRQRLAERKLRQLGPFSRVRAFIKRLGVDVALDGEIDVQVTAAIALRDVIVHNGGRADQEYLQRASRTDVATGAVLRVSRAELREALQALRKAADAVQVALGDKYFGGARSELSRWWSP